MRSQLRPVVSGQEVLIGSIGEVVSFANDSGLMRLRGELWQIRSTSPLVQGQQVVVESRKGLILWVRPGSLK